MRPLPAFLIIASLTILLYLSGCVSKQDLALEIENAVAGTLTALPTPTPDATVTPTWQPEPLAGLFCEYQFCVGHPGHVVFFDVNAQRNPASPNSYAQGILAAYDTNVFIELIWQSVLSNPDPQAILELVLEEGVDIRDGRLDVMLVRDLNVFYTALSATATPLLPSGGAAAWTCGDREFAWKVYTSGDLSSKTLLEDAVNKFRCK